MTAPVASVLVPTHRGAHRLPALLDALAGQDVTGPWEVVVAVDGVLDETPEVLQGYAARLPLRVLRSAAPRGLAHTLNAAYDTAAGDVLIRCDDDLTPGPDMVRRHVHWHAYTAGPVGVIGLTRDVFADTPYARSYGLPANRRQLAAAYAREHDRRWMHWAAHNSMDRETWRRVGGFDVRFAYREDSDLGLRLHLAGVSIVIDPALEIAHRGPATSARTRAARAFVSGSSRRLFETVHAAAGPTDAPAGAAGRSMRAAVWDAATAAVSTVVHTPVGFGRIGSAADRVPMVADGLRGRLVAFAVESADRAGYRYGRGDADEFRAQKGAEVAQERSTRSAPVGES